MIKRIVLAAVLVMAVSGLRLTGAPAARAASASTWPRAVLIYHSPGRTALQWERHLMRVDAAGQFTGQWLFGAAILTTQQIDGQDIMSASLTGSQLSDLLAEEFGDAAALDAAAATLAAAYGPPPQRIQVAVALPWLSPRDPSVTVAGISYDMSVPAQRMAVTTWYLDQVESMAAAADWTGLSLYGIYCQREDASTAWGDPGYLTSMNAQAHRMGLSTVWVPCYDAPGAFSGASLGFTVTDIQPEYAFRDSQYEGVVNDGRLYSAGSKAAGQGQATEYELSSQGNSVTEEQVAHQYLAVAQATGASAYPQVFFDGLTSDLLDQAAGAAAVDASEWQAYTDLAAYLAGQPIANTDLAVPRSPVTTAGGALQQDWTLPAPATLTSVRLDFDDASAASPWRGQVTVTVTGPGGTRSAYSVRGGTDTVNPRYDSVYVPLPAAATGNDTVTSAIITVTRQPGSPWPTVLRVVGGVGGPPAIASGNDGATSTASPLVARPGPYSDSRPAYAGYYAGRLTDGLVSPSGSWGWGGVVGWNSEDGPVSITIRLSRAQAVGSVSLITHEDQLDGINWPDDVSVSVGTGCAPQDTGIPGQSCEPAATSGPATLTSRAVTGGVDAADTAGTISLPLASVTGQYVTVSGVCSGWCMFDEVRVLSPAGAVISTAAPYTVTPMPTSGPGGGVTYGDDDYKLTDGAVIAAYGPQFADALDGIPAGTGGSVQATWLDPHRAGSAAVWITAADHAAGVIVPSAVTMSWRNASGVWQAGTAVTPTASCGPAPCARLTLPAGAQVTGIRAVFPGGGPAADWYLVSQLSTQ